MYLEIFLVDFAVFRVFLGISRDFAEIPEFRGSATARNIRSPVITFQLPNCWNNLSQISRKIISHGANPLHNREQLECKKRVGRQHTTFTLFQNAACSNEYFLLQLDYALEGLHFDWANYVIFATCLMQRGRDTTKA